MHLFMDRFLQALTTLDLGSNRIGAQGAEHLANALQQNIVWLFTSLDLLCNLFIHHSPQTLTTLDLGSNRIGAQGAEHLVNALQQNIVRLFTPLDFYATIHSSFSADTHNTWSRAQPNRCSRRRTSCKCIAAKRGKIAHTTRLPMHPFIHPFPQTLVTLHLELNQIGDQGAKHLANALQQNKVRFLTPLDFLCLYSFILFHRHS
jgi:hypothetical protein